MFPALASEFLTTGPPGKSRLTSPVLEFHINEITQFFVSGLLLLGIMFLRFSYTVVCTVVSILHSFFLFSSIPLCEHTSVCLLLFPIIDNCIISSLRPLLIKYL